MSRSRAEAIIAIVQDLERCVYQLDALQVGDVKGRISPVKHELMDALRSPVDHIREIAQAEYLTPEPGELGELREVDLRQGIEAHKPDGGAVFFYTHGWTEDTGGDDEQ